MRFRPPAIDGLAASRLQLPPGAWATVLDCLCERFPAVSRNTWLDRMARGRVLDDAGRPVTPDTRFTVASANKMLTAVAIAQLHEAGRLQFDDPIGKYLPDYPNKEMAKVTIRQLLSHQGGTGDIGVLLPEEGANRAWARTIDDLMKLNGDRGPSFAPGTAFDYSNYGFLLLGAFPPEANVQPVQKVLPNDRFTRSN